jgi:hypothetical protein
LELAVEDGDADALGGEGVGVAVRQARDEALETQASEVVAHLGGGVWLAEESGDVPAKAFVGEAGDGVQQDVQGAGQSHGA